MLVELMKLCWVMARRGGVGDTYAVIGRRELSDTYAVIGKRELDDLKDSLDAAGGGLKHSNRGQ